MEEGQRVVIYVSCCSGTWERMCGPSAEGQRGEKVKRFALSCLKCDFTLHVSVTVSYNLFYSFLFLLMHV